MYNARSLFGGTKFHSLGFSHNIINSYMYSLCLGDTQIHIGKV